MGGAFRTTSGNKGSDCGAAGKFGLAPQKQKRPQMRAILNQEGPKEPHCTASGSFVGCLLLGDLLVCSLLVGRFGGLGRLGSVRGLGDRSGSISSHGHGCSSRGGSWSGCGRLCKSTGSQQTSHQDSEEFFHICRFLRGVERRVKGPAFQLQSPLTTIAVARTLTGVCAKKLSLESFGNRLAHCCLACPTGNSPP